MPDGHEGDEEQGSEEHASHYSDTSPAEWPFKARVILPACSASSMLLISRGRGSGISNCSRMRPGFREKSITRSARQTASRTLWVTKTMVLRRFCKIRWMSL